MQYTKSQQRKLNDLESRIRIGEKYGGDLSKHRAQLEEMKKDYAAKNTEKRHRDILKYLARIKQQEE